jgi:hypothetical protein
MPCPRNLLQRPVPSADLWADGSFESRQNRSHNEGGRTGIASAVMSMPPIGGHGMPCP